MNSNEIEAQAKALAPVFSRLLEKKKKKMKSELEKRDARIAELQSARKALSHLADACSAGNEGPCPIIASFEAVAAR